MQMSRCVWHVVDLPLSYKDQVPQNSLVLCCLHLTVRPGSHAASIHRALALLLHGWVMLHGVWYQTYAVLLLSVNFWVLSLILHLQCRHESPCVTLYFCNCVFKTEPQE